MKSLTMKTALRGGAFALGLLGFFFLGAQQSQEAEARFVLSGWEWSGASADWRFNNNFPGSAGSTAAIQTDMEESAQTWRDDVCSNFQFNYLGNTTSTTVAPNGNNDVFYTGAAGNGTLAVATSWGTSGPGGVINFTNFDIRFFGDVNWNVSPNGGQFDIQGVATHEFGHALGLDHSVTDSDATMWASTGPGGNSIMRRSLEQDDIDGCIAIYGNDPSCGALQIPGPNPPQWSQLPNSIGGGALMAAVAGSPGPVEYEFDYVGTAPGGDDRPWSTSASYFDAGLSQPNSSYAYRFRMRNALDPSLVTAWSTTESVTTPANPPGLVSVGSVSNRSFQIEAIDLNGNLGGASTAIQVGSMFLSFSGQLQPSPLYLPDNFWVGTTVVGLDRETSYGVRAQIWGADGVVTAPGPTNTVTTTIMHEPFAAGQVLDAAGDPESALLINGSDGGATRRVNITAGTPFSIDLVKPSLNGAAVANWIMWARYGEPDLGDEWPLPSGIGTLAFIPCDIQPAPGSITIGSTYGPLACPLSLPSPLAPATIFASPGIAFPVINLCFQAVIEQSPGVLRTTNAVLLTNQ
jgi:Matrixin